jgi:hypothetical protein
MRISADQLAQESLTEFGVLAAKLLATRELSQLSEKFGYALAFGREPAAAIAEDLARCLCGQNASPASEYPKITVKYFKENESSLLALVECYVQMTASANILLELVAARNGEAINLYLEGLIDVA